MTRVGRPHCQTRTRNVPQELDAIRDPWLAAPPDARACPHSGGTAMTRPHDTSRDDCVDSVPDEAKGWLAGACGESQRLTQMRRRRDVTPPHLMTAILRLTQEDSRVDRSRLVLTTALEVIL